MSSSSQDQTPQPRDTGTGTQSEAPPRQTGRHQVPRQATQYEDTTRYEESAERAPSGAAMGLTIMAAVLMMVSGAFNFFEGLAAVIRGSYFIVLPNYAFNLSVRGWGWFHLILGVVVFVVGAALLTDKLWARAAGVIVASLSAIINFLYIPYYPFWSIALVALDVAIIWALLAPRTRSSSYY
jgi:hypothetical protein